MFLARGGPEHLVPTSMLSQHVWLSGSGADRVVTPAADQHWGLSFPHSLVDLVSV